MTRLEQIQELINDPKQANKTQGQLTRELLEAKGIESPPANERIEIRPGLEVQPKKPFKNKQEREEWILAMQKKYESKINKI